MTIKVDMTEEEFEEFLKFRKERKVEYENHVALRKAFREFSEAVWQSVDTDARKVIEPETLLKAVQRAEQYRWL